MKRNAAALILCIMLLCQMIIPSAGAAENIYFVATGEYILPVSDSTMPFWHSGYLYVAGSVFTGTAKDSLDVAYLYNKASDAAILYRG